MKKTLFLSLALVAMMVMACGPSQEEVAAEAATQEQLTADSVLAFDEAGLIQAEAEDAITDTTVVETPVAE